MSAVRLSRKSRRRILILFSLSWATLSEHAGGKEEVQLAYEGDGSTTLTTAGGATRANTFTTGRGARKPISNNGDFCSQCPGGDIKARKYDSNTFLDEVRGWNNHVTQTVRISRGRVEMVTHRRKTTT